MDDAIDEIRKLLKRKSGLGFRFAETGFEIGRLVAGACEERKEVPVSALARRLSGGEGGVSERYLLHCLMVYRSVKKAETLRHINRKLHGNVSWGFLVRNCTKAPQGDSEAARLYWEGVLEDVERSLVELERLASWEGTLPDDIKEQVAGLVSGLGLGLISGARAQDDAPAGPYKVAHLSDLHFHEGFTTAGRDAVDPETGLNERLIDIHRCFRHAVDKAIEAGCRLALITEPFETHRPTPNEQKLFQEEALRLAERMPVIVEPGNHGRSQRPQDATSVEFLKGRHNIHVVEAPAVFYQEGLTLHSEKPAGWPGTGSARIFVLPFPNRNIVGPDAEDLTIVALNARASERLKLILEVWRSEHDPDVPNVLLTHFTVSGSEGKGADSRVRFDPVLHPDDLRGFDYIALGHEHRHRKVFGTENAWYAGSIDRMDFGEEDDPKGFIIAAFIGKSPDVEFVETPARKFKTLSPEFFRAEGFEGLIDPETVYRVKGEVALEEYDALRPVIRRYGLQNSLTVKRQVRIRDERMTEDVSDEEALRCFCVNQAVDGSVLELLLGMHRAVIEETNGR